MIELTGYTLTLEEVRRIIHHKEKVIISKDSLKDVVKSHEAVQKIVRNGNVVYGINTGFGKLSDCIIAQEDVEDLQLNLIRSHACGVGTHFPEKVSRTMLLLRANALLKGYSGVTPQLIERLVDYLNREIHPLIPSQGSLGASGDLAPLAHLALTLIGEGKVFYKGRHIRTAEALNKESLSPLKLSAKEGLALINGTQAMTAVGIIAYLQAEKLAYQSEWIGALTIEGLEGIIDAFDESIHIARGYKQQIETAERIRDYLAGSKLTTKQGEKRVQDAYSIRCIPQVHGASWQALDYVKEKLQVEMNAATDNPLIFDEGKKVLSGGNFHGQPIAFAMDFLKIAVAELANISERRIERLVNPMLNNGLPAFLSPEPGLQSGAMILQYTAASLVSENKTLAHPASVDSIPSSANQEDHVSMGTIAARHAYEIIQNAYKVLAIELICALQAVELRGVEKMAETTRKLYMEARQIIPSIKKDRIFSSDMENGALWLKNEAKGNGEN